MTALTNGAKIGLSSALPAAFTAAAYGALTFIDIAEAISVDPNKKTSNVVSQNFLGDNFPTKFKGSFDVGDVTITVGTNSADAGQSLLETALASNNSYAFKLLLPSGSIGYFTAKVVSDEALGASTDSVETTTYTLAVDANSRVKV